MNDNTKLESITEDLEGIIEDHDAEVESIIDGIEDEVPEDLAAEMYTQRLAEAVAARQR